MGETAVGELRAGAVADGKAEAVGETGAGELRAMAVADGTAGAVILGGIAGVAVLAGVGARLHPVNAMSAPTASQGESLCGKRSNTVERTGLVARAKNGSRIVSRMATIYVPSLEF